MKNSDQIATTKGIEILYSTRLHNYARLAFAFWIAGLNFKYFGGCCSSISEALRKDRVKR